MIPKKQTERPRTKDVKIGWLNVRSIHNKTTAVSELIEDRDYDLFVATETWHRNENDIGLKQASGPGYSISEYSRETGRGGGVAIFYRSNFNRTQIALPKVTTFEYVCDRFRKGSNAFAILAVYRPGSERHTSLLYDELAEILEVIVLQACPVIIGGDFNIHVQKADDHDAKRLHDLLNTFNLVQHVQSATHRAQGTLDLVMTFADDLETVAVEVDPSSIISDHGCVTSTHGLPTMSSSTCYKEV